MEKWFLWMSDVGFYQIPRTYLPKIHSCLTFFKNGNTFSSSKRDVVLINANMVGGGEFSKTEGL